MSYIFRKDITIPNKDLALFYAPFEHKNMIKDFNNLCIKHIGKENYIKNIESEKQYFLCSINKGNLTSQILAKKIEKYRDEITRFFTKNNFQAHMKVEKKGANEVQIHIYNKSSLWETQTLSLESLKLEKGELLAGFFPQIVKGVSYKNYSLKTSDMIHSFCAGATRSGKDVFMRNIFLSILYQIKHFSNMELHFFDTKGNDGVFLENLKSYGVYRHKDIGEYTGKLEKLVKEMRNTQERIGAYSNYLEYNKQSGKEKIKEKFIVINEFLSLTQKIQDKKELTKLLGYLVSLTSEGAGAGIKCIFMSQTARKDSNAQISQILVNVKTKFALKVNNLEESFILSRGLSETEKLRVTHIQQHNCLHIEDGKIQKEIKAYYFSQQDLRKWIDKNFEKQQEFEKSKINDYLKYAEENDEISMKIATEKFGFTRTDWDTFIQYLEKNNLISRLDNNKIIWRKEERNK